MPNWKNVGKKLLKEFKNYTNIKNKYSVIVIILIFIAGIVSKYGIDRITCSWNEIINPIEVQMPNRIEDINGEKHLTFNIRNNLCSPLEDPYAKITFNCDFYFGTFSYEAEPIPSFIEPGSRGVFVLRNDNFTETILPRNETCYDALQITYKIQKIDNTHAALKEKYALLYNNFSGNVDFVDLTDTMNVTKKLCSHCFYNITLHSGSNIFSYKSDKELPLSASSFLIPSFNSSELYVLQIDMNSSVGYYSALVTPTKRMGYYKAFEKCMQDKFNVSKIGYMGSETYNVSSGKKIDITFPTCQ